MWDRSKTGWACWPRRWTASRPVSAGHADGIDRYQGASRLRRTAPEVVQAEACFHQALAVARRQEAKSLELRSAMSLARLWDHQGKRVEACALLAPIYGWFTDGFDTADLQEAKALLEALA